MASQKVVVSGAAGQIGYALVPLIAQGDLLGPDTRIELRLLDIEPALHGLEGVAAELQDCAFALLEKVIVTADPRVAFEGANIAILAGAFPRKEGMERKDLLEKNAHIFREQGIVLGEVADPDCHILVVGNPANTNALTLLTAAKGKLKPENVTAMTRLDHNRCLAQLAAKASVPVTAVRNAIIWGNHSSTQVPDINSALINGEPARTVIQDDNYLDDQLQSTVRERGGEIIRLRSLSSAMSAARAAVDHVRDWIFGTPEGVIVSMGVYSNGNPYNVPWGLICSFPCTCKDGEWSIVPDVCISPAVEEGMTTSVMELLEEKSAVGVSTTQNVYHPYLHVAAENFDKKTPKISVFKPLKKKF